MYQNILSYSHLNNQEKIPYCFAYLRITGSYTCTSALTGVTLVELSPPVMLRKPPNSITIIKIRIHPPATRAESKNFAAAMIDFTALTVDFAIFCAAFADCFAPCAVFFAVSLYAFAILCAFFAVCSVVFIVVLAVRCAVLTDFPVFFTDFCPVLLIPRPICRVVLILFLPWLVVLTASLETSVLCGICSFGRISHLPLTSLPQKISAS